jgi:hypothetical protein
VPENNISKHWQKSVKERCWCKHVAGKDPNAKIKTGSFEHYACINFFLQLLVPSNEILNGMVLASIVCRKALYIERVPFISGWDDESLCDKHQFVSIRQIEMTGIGALPFDRGDDEMNMDHPYFRTYGRFEYADGETEVPEDPYQANAPTGQGYPTIVLPNIDETLRVPLSRWKQLPEKFKPFCVYSNRIADTAKGVGSFYSTVKDYKRLGCLIPVELDRENIGWKWWTDYYDKKFRVISRETRKNAARLIAPAKDDEEED